MGGSGTLKPFRPSDIMQYLTTSSTTTKQTRHNVSKVLFTSFVSSREGNRYNIASTKRFRVLAISILLSCLDCSANTAQTNLGLDSKCKCWQPTLVLHKLTITIPLTIMQTLDFQASILYRTRAIMIEGLFENNTWPSDLLPTTERDKCQDLFNPRLVHDRKESEVRNPTGQSLGFGAQPTQTLSKDMPISWPWHESDDTGGHNERYQHRHKKL